jgi:rare lipoprotein A
MNATVTFAILGLASWYGPEHRGDIMANGRPFEPWAMTCAAQDYPFGTQLLVAHGDREVIVRVTDRLGEAAIRHGCLLDLSEAAFEAIADPSRGVISVRYSVLRQGGPEAARLAHNQEVIGSNPIPAPFAAAGTFAVDQVRGSLARLLAATGGGLFLRRRCSPAGLANRRIHMQPALCRQRSGRLRSAREHNRALFHGHL